jgi:hypothetical protein
MNVSGVGATPPQPPLPPVAPTATVTSPTASDGRPSGEPRPGSSAKAEAARDAAQQKTERVEAPPLRMLTVTEMRIMLGQLPVSAGLKPEDRGGETAGAA